MPSWHGEGQLIVSVTDHISETTELSEVTCVLKLVNVHIQLGINPLNPKLNSICYLLALLGARHFLHVSRIRVKLLTLR
jgi:transposase